MMCSEPILGGDRAAAASTAGSCRGPILGPYRPVGNAIT